MPAFIPIVPRVRTPPSPDVVKLFPKMPSTFSRSGLVTSSRHTLVIAMVFSWVNP